MGGARPISRYAPVISAVFLARFAIVGNRVIIEEFERSGYDLLHRLTIPFPHDLCWDRPSDKILFEQVKLYGKPCSQGQNTRCSLANDVCPKKQ